MSEKKINSISFVEGINTDISDELLPPGMYRYAMNIRIFSNGDKGIAKNVKGTIEIPFEKPAGRSVTIGSKEDTENNKFYFFNWNENGYHAIYQYDDLLNKVNLVFQNLTDTNGVDILKFTEKGLILHIDIREGNLIYWAEETNKPRKINIKKAMDKSESGYGEDILEEYINAYKKAPLFPPSISYFTDTARLTNYLYGKLYKAVGRHYFDDKEKSNWSEYSIVPLPDKESFTGNASVSNLNNGLKIGVESGSRIVTDIEIGLKINNNEFVSIAVLNKKKLNISDNTTYEYKFYNDSVSYSGIDKNDVARAYSFMPDKPALQAITKGAMIYGDGEEGFEDVTVDISSETTYSDLFIDSGTESKMNEPYFAQTYYDYTFTKKGSGRRRNSDIQLTIGHDVKAGNKFEMWGKNNDGDNKYFFYVATNSDDAISVANQFKQQLVATGRIITHAEDLPNRDIWNNEINGFNDVSFRFLWYGQYNTNPTSFGTTNKPPAKEKTTSTPPRVNPVSYQSLKDNGQSEPTQKSGGTRKYGIVYWNDDTKRSNVYTSDEAVLRNSFITETGGYKRITHALSIKHKPPIWAKYWELVRTIDLTYGNDFIHVLIQKAIESQSDTNTEYVDLVIGSLLTYQKMFPNTVVSFPFAKNDRVRLIRKEPSGAYYPFLETVVLDYKDYFEEVKNEDVSTNKTSIVTITGITNPDNINRYISIEGVERLITGVPSATTYQLDRDISFSPDATTKYPQYKIIDRRGIIRVRKPATSTGIEIDDNSLIEVYKPTQNVEAAEKQFFLFGKKFNIINPGTEQRAHAGSDQHQDPLNPATTPAIVKISKGTTYVRSRTLPTNNAIPGTQAAYDFVEDKGFSDFYESDLNDNGKIAPQDLGEGITRFGDRLRFSNINIEGTKLNGFNDFDNTSREDYSDKYGKFMLIFYRDNVLHAFKQLKTGYIPVMGTIIQDQKGNELLGASNKLLNDLRYYSWEGGIGNNPESFASNQTWMWFASANSGTFCRTGGNGILPISKQFGVDTTIRELFRKSEKYGTRIFGGFDSENDEYIPCFEPHNEYLYNSGFVKANWTLVSGVVTEVTQYEITTNPPNGTVVINEDNLFNYTPNTDYIGTDYFFFRKKEPGGEWETPKRVCITVVEVEQPPADITYYNTQLTVPFTKNNCVDGYHGSVVDYIVDPFVYDSVFSQEDADQQAQDEADENGQAIANDIGECLINNPDGFSFTDQTGLEVSTLTESNAVTINGDYDKYLIPVSVGGEYQIDGGVWTSAAGIILNGSSVKMRNTTSDEYSTAVNTILTVGEVGDTFTITTKTIAFKWVPDESTAYCETQNIVINNFDYLVARFIWEYPAAGKDLDIQVQFENNSTPTVDNKYVGYGGVDPTVPVSTIPETNAYLWWALDDTNPGLEPSTGIEGVLVGMKKFRDDFSGSPNIIEVALYCVWYSSVSSGDFQLEVATYLGGAMSKSGTNIINTGGVQVSSDVRNLNTLIQNKLRTPASSYKVGVLRYNKTTDSAVLILS